MPQKKSAPKRKKKATAKSNGRPPIDIDYEQVERMSEQQCTEYEIAYFLGLTAEGFRQRKGKDAELLGALKKGRAVGHSSLRRMQWDKAQDGNTTMQIWLGKQYLGQKDKNEVDTTTAVHVTITKPDRTKDNTKG